MSEPNAADGTEHPTTVPAADDALQQRQRVRAVVDEEFSSFYRATIRRLTGFLIHHGASLSVAADLAQDTMIKAYRRWDEIEQPQAWVHTVAARALARRVADVREWLVEVNESSALLPVPDAHAHWELQHDLMQLVKALPYRQRQVMAWTLSGYTPAEIASELRLTPEAVRSSLRKARQKLAEHNTDERRFA